MNPFEIVEAQMKIIDDSMRKHFSKPRKLEVKDLDEPVENKYANLKPEDDIFDQEAITKEELAEDQ